MTEPRLQEISYNLGGYMTQCKHTETHLGYDGKNVEGSIIATEATVCDDCGEVLDSYWMQEEIKNRQAFQESDKQNKYFELEGKYREAYELWVRWTDSRYRSFSKFLFDEQGNQIEFCIGCKKETPYLIEYKNEMICKQCNNGRLRGR